MITKEKEIKNDHISSNSLGHIATANPIIWKENQEQRKTSLEIVKTYQLIQPCGEEEKPHAHAGRR